MSHVIVTDESMRGAGTDTDPLAVDAASLDGEVAVAHDATLTGDGTTASPLSVVGVPPPPLVVVHDGTLTGDGSLGTPLAVVPSSLDELVRVAADATIAGDGLTGTPLAVVPSSLASQVPVSTDATLTGDGTAGSPLHAVGSIPFTSWRKIGSGSSGQFAGGATVTLMTFSRLAGERLVPLGFVTNNVEGAQWSEESPDAGLADVVTMWIERTSNANECKLRANNRNAGGNRTIEWLLIGIVP